MGCLPMRHAAPYGCISAMRRLPGNKCAPTDGRTSSRRAFQICDTPLVV